MCVFSGPRAVFGTKRDVAALVFSSLIFKLFFQLENIDNSASFRLVQSVRGLDDHPSPTQTITHGQEALSELFDKLLGLIQFVKLRKR